MTESLLLYMNLRSKQIVRVLAGIGLFRCLFLIGIAAIMFYAFAKVTSVWVLPVCYLLMLWLYHNSRKDKEFLSLQGMESKDCLRQNIYCSVYRLLFRG